MEDPRPGRRGAGVIPQARGYSRAAALWLGLDFIAGKDGLAATSLPAETAEKHAALSARLAEVTVPPDTSPRGARKAQRSGASLVTHCRCVPPRVLAIPQATYSAGGIVCAVCRRTFKRAVT